MGESHVKRYRYAFPALFSFAIALAVLGLLLDDPENILPGFATIILTEDSLITDYIQIAGPGAAFVNAALITLISALILWLAREPVNGYTAVEIGLMSGFALFGKNIVNIWPIILGTFLYAKLVRREPFSRYASVSLLATALAPVVSYVGLDNGWGNAAWGMVVGVLIGFILPPLAIYTFKIQNGMNLYNMGFACGLVAMVLVPVMLSMGAEPLSADHWATGYNLPLGAALVIFCGVLLAAGFFFGGRSPRRAWIGYCRLLRTTGRAPSDFLRMFGAGPVMINAGVNGLIGMAVILLTGGDLNGPTLGGILAIMGFSAYGKHAFNILPVMAGVLLGSTFMSWHINDHTVQLAVLFCTTLAPISGHFGWPFGMLAGFLHASVVLHAGTPVEGLNLYNNGFSGGLVAIVLYPLITAVVGRHKPELQDKEYMDNFLDNSPLEPPTERRRRWRRRR